MTGVIVATVRFLSVPAAPLRALHHVAEYLFFSSSYDRAAICNTGRQDACPVCQGSYEPNECCSRSVEHHWKIMPPEARQFILREGHINKCDGFISLEKLIDFWSGPKYVGLTRRVDIVGASWYLVSVGGDCLPTWPDVAPFDRGPHSRDLHINRLPPGAHIHEARRHEESTSAYM